MQSRNKRNDRLFRRWYSEKIVKFVGGPMHNEVLQIQELLPEYRCAMPMFDGSVLQISEFAKPVKIAKYRLMQDGFVVYLLGWNKLWVYVFSEIE